MIKIIPDNSTGKITKIEYENNGYKKTIGPKIFAVTKTNDQNNVGTILEHYRKLTAEAEKYFSDNKTTLDNFINNVSISYDSFEPDHIVCFLPADKNRNQLLKQFAEKIKANFSNKDDIDFSDKFVKKDRSKSIKNGLTKNDYDLLLDKETPVIKKLLIIDDTIDKGDTLNIYLNKLFEKNLINTETLINMVCIYNNEKMEKINYLQAFKEKQNKREE